MAAGGMKLNTEQMFKNNEDANKKEKMRNWCDMCHNQHDCEDKESFLDSECESCFQYA